MRVKLLPLLLVHISCLKFPLWTRGGAVGGVTAGVQPDVGELLPWLPGVFVGVEVNDPSAVSDGAVSIRLKSC